VICPLCEIGFGSTEHYRPNSLRLISTNWTGIGQRKLVTGLIRVIITAPYRPNSRQWSGISRVQSGLFHFNGEATRHRNERNRPTPIESHMTDNRRFQSVSRQSDLWYYKQNPPLPLYLRPIFVPQHQGSELESDGKWTPIGQEVDGNWAGSRGERDAIWPAC